MSKNDASNDRDCAIRAIPTAVCRKINTGQVIISLDGACKELVDNALDAKANIIEIRVKRSGFEALEVIDNGVGIHSSNFDSLCKSHSTSKLTDFNDFRSLSTFGFRGEALSALCSVSSLTITTRHRDESVASMLEFDHNGSIKWIEKCARQVGTSIAISSLFETLPVRRKEFEKSIKKSFCKLLNVVQSFALSRTDVRFVVNSLCNGKQHQTLMTPGGNSTTKEVIINLFGARSEKNAVLEIIQQAPDESVRNLYGLSDSANLSEIRYVLKILQLCRITTEVYQQYNPGQNCMLILFVEVPSDSIDVNVSPDKRSVFFMHEKELLAVLRASLLATFATVLGQIGIASTQKKTHIAQRKENSNPSVDGVEREPFDCFSYQKNHVKRRIEQTPNFGPPKKRPASRLLEDFKFQIISHVPSSSTDLTENCVSNLKGTDESLEAIEYDVNGAIDGVTQLDGEINQSQFDGIAPSCSSDLKFLLQTPLSKNYSIMNVDDDCASNLVEEVQFCGEQMTLASTSACTLKSGKMKHMMEKNAACLRVDFCTESTKRAEEQLDEFLNKDAFESMQIIGQFNKGFIITQYRSELYIVDQHASDEKHMFEQLQKKTVITKQQLISPRVLNLGAVKEAILMENIDIFSFNGFEFLIDEKEEPGRRAMATAFPELHNCVLNTSDIEEMLSVLDKYPSTMYRPAKVRRVFASKACRGSVMIGSALSTQKMERNCPHGRPTLRHLCSIITPDSSNLSS